MRSDNLRPIPTSEVAARCELLVLNPHVPPDAAWVLALVAQRLRELDATLSETNDRLLAALHRAEQSEADAAHLFHLHYGPQKGGAA